MPAPIRLLLAVVVTTLLLATTCSKSPTDDDDDADPDSRPPELIADLHVVTVTTTSATLQWTAPADHRDDNSHGFVQEYDLRVSYDSLTAVNFSLGHRIDSVNATAPPGALVQASIDLLEPDSSYYFAIKARDDHGNWSGLSNCCHTHCPGIEVVTFADTALQRIVREHIHKPTGDILSPDVDTVTQLIAENLGISSLSGLEYFHSLENVLFAGNAISDLTPLSNLTNLWGLHLSWNNISDMSPVAGLTGVTQLHLGINPLTSIAPIVTMTGLQQVWLYETLVTDFTPLQSLPHLSDIHLGSNGITDISFVSGLTHLVTAQFVMNQITDLSPLEGMTTLENLGFSHNQVSSIGPLQSLTSLRNLDMTYNGVADLLPLVNNTGVGSGDYLYLSENPLSTQSTSEYIPALEARGATVYH